MGERQWKQKGRLWDFCDIGNGPDDNLSRNIATEGMSSSLSLDYYKNSGLGVMREEGEKEEEKEKKREVRSWETVKHTGYLHWVRVSGRWTWNCHESCDFAGVCVIYWISKSRSPYS